MNEYPTDIGQLDLDNMDFPPAAIAAGMTLARSRPWRGTVEERQHKLLHFVSELSAAYDRAAPRVVFDLRGSHSDGCYYCPTTNTVVLRGSNMSVISLAHEVYHHILGPSELHVCRASLGLFMRCFPRSWRRLRFDRHMARSMRRDEGMEQQ